MAKYFLGSVGKAEAFRVDDNGNRVLAFVSKTLTDSGLNISTTKDDIRAGQGAPIQFSFYHDPSVEINLTDVLWKKEYLTAQLGAKFEQDGNGEATDYLTATVTFTGGVANGAALNIQKTNIPCQGDAYLVWGAKKGTEDYKIIGYDDSTKNLSLTGAEGDYCVRYLGKTDKATAAEITSLIVPEELFLIITAPIFAGDACAASKGEAAGHITFEVPRFQLNGSQEFSMNMSSNQTMSLAGIALASESDNCDAEGGKLLRVIEFIKNRSFADDAVSIMVDSESLDVGGKPSIYVELPDGHLKHIEGEDLTNIEYKYKATEEGEYGSYTALTAASITLAAGYYVFRIIGSDTATDELEVEA